MLSDKYSPPPPFQRQDAAVQETIRLPNVRSLVHLDQCCQFSLAATLQDVFHMTFLMAPLHTKRVLCQLAIACPLTPECWTEPAKQLYNNSITEKSLFNTDSM